MHKNQRMNAINVNKSIYKEPNLSASSANRLL